MGYMASAYLQCQHARASDSFSAAGDAQASSLNVSEETIDADQTELFIDGTVGNSIRAILPASRTWAFSIMVAARQTGGAAGTVGDSGIYKLEGGIKRDGASNTALIGSVTKTTIAEDQAAWDVTAVADDSHEALVVKVTGEADKIIHWVAAINLVEVG